MTYLQTEYFLHVAQNKSITKTASELYVSPPAISKQIALLEQELGIERFVRGASEAGFRRHKTYPASRRSGQMLSL